MVSTRRFGRLGNALYMYAAMIAYAKKHDSDYHFPTVTNNNVWNPIYFTELANNKWVNGVEDVLINEHGHHYQELPFEKEWRDLQIVLNGYWQSYKYFDWCKEEVLRVFNFPYEMNKGVCSIHVRRGDYLLYPTRHPVVTIEYLENAMMEVMGRYGSHLKFKVFSDDIEWCKENVPKLYGAPIEFSEGKTELQDLIEMANSEHNICSNSTMSTWASELNRNPNKIVVVPSEGNWFGVDNSHLAVHDMYRPEWVQIAY